MTEARQNKRSPWVVILLIALPLWLLASAAGALWYYFHREEKQSQVEQARFAQAVSIPLLADDLKKIVEIVGERNGSSAQAAANLSRTASMIEGLLGPSNTGYKVVRHKGPGEWPLLQITLRGRSPDTPAIWVATSYDSRPGSRGAEANATGLAATLAAAQAMAADKPIRPVHFLFLPHANDPDGPVLPTAARLSEIIRSSSPPAALLAVEAMGAGESLWISSRDSSSLAVARIATLGSAHGAEDVCLGDDSDLASILFEMNLPAARVSTRTQTLGTGPDDRLPFAPTVAAATGRLIELIRRCAAEPIGTR